MSSKLTELTELTAPVSSDILYIVDDPSGTPLSRKVTAANLVKALIPSTDTQVLFNDGGSAIGGDASLTWNKTTDTLTIGTSGADGERAKLLANTTAQTANLLESYTSGSALRAKITASAEFSNTGGISKNEIFGAGASVAGTGSFGSVAFGFNASVTLDGGVAVGATAQAADQSTAIGVEADADSSGAGNDSVAVGFQARCLGTSGVALGRLADCNAAECIAIGNSADAWESCIAIGSDSLAGSSMVADAIAIGRNAVCTTANRVVFGGTGGHDATSCLFGNGETNVSPPASFTLTATGGSGTNIAATDIVITSGIPTGNATPSSVTITATAAGGSGSSAQSPFNAVVIDGSGVAIDNYGASITPLTLGGTNGIDYTPSSDANVDIATISVTGTPRFHWNETGDVFEMTHGLTVGGDIDVNNNTISNAKLTAPEINDTSADHQYIFAVSELAADRTVTLPLLTGNDTFVFNDFTATLTNKTISGASNTVGVTVGGAVGSGTANRIFFEDGSNQVAQDADLTWDGTTFKIGSDAGAPAGTTALLSARSDVNQEARFTVANNSTGASAHATIACHNDDGTDATEVVRMIAIGRNFTTVGGFIQDAGVFSADGGLSGGLVFMARAGGAGIKFYAGGHSNQVGEFATDQSFYVGNGETASSPLAGTLGGTSGSGTDITGANLTVHPGIGTGTGNSGRLRFRAAVSGMTGSSLNSLADVFEITADSALKIAFFGATAVIQQATTGTTSGFTAGSGTGVNDDSTFTGNSGTAAYTIGDIVLALKNYGLLAAS